MMSTLKPYMYAIDDGTGQPEMNETCVAEEPSCLEDQVCFYNEDNPENIQHKVVKLYSHAQVCEMMKAVAEYAEISRAFIWRTGKDYAFDDWTRSNNDINEMLKEFHEES